MTWSRFLLALAFLFVVFDAKAQVPFLGKCPNIPVQGNFKPNLSTNCGGQDVWCDTDLDGDDKPVKEEIVFCFFTWQYLGSWYDIAHYKWVYEIGTKCDKARYSLKKNGYIKITHSFQYFESFPKLINPHTPGEAFPDPSGEARLFVRFSNGSFPKRPSYNILSTDYETYSLIYSCREFDGGVFHLQNAWIFSRKPTISQRLTKKLLLEFEKAGIKSQPFIFTPQGIDGNCTYAGSGVNSYQEDMYNRYILERSYQ